MLSIFFSLDVNLPEGWLTSLLGAGGRAQVVPGAFCATLVFRFIAPPCFVPCCLAGPVINRRQSARCILFQFPSWFVYGRSFKFLLFGHNDFHKIFTSPLISLVGFRDIPLCRLVKPSRIFYDAGSRNFGLQYCNSELTPTEGSLFPLVSSIGSSGCWESYLTWFSAHNLWVELYCVFQLVADNAVLCNIFPPVITLKQNATKILKSWNLSFAG